MTRAVHVSIVVICVLTGVVTAGLALRVGNVGPFAAWLAAAMVVSASAQTYVGWLQWRAHDRAKAATAALREAHGHLIDEMLAARERNQALQTALATSERERERAMDVQAARFDEALAVMRRHVELGALGDDDGHDRLSRRTSLGEQPQTSPRRAAQARRDGQLTAGDIGAALQAGRVELMAQPIVKLPQRKPVHYEVFTHLRGVDGASVRPAQWIGAAEDSGLIAQLDAGAALRSLRLARRLDRAGRRTGVFCNISAATLGHDMHFANLLDAVKGETQGAEDVIFELRQHDLRGFDLIALRNMRRLSEFGFRFSLDHVRDMDLDFERLRGSHVRFVKINGETLVDLLRAGGPLGGGVARDVHVEDFPDVLARQGLSLIAEKVENEATVLEALDYAIPLAQGHLFGAPRPVRADAVAQAA